MQSELQNATPFGARLMPSADRDGRDLLLLVVAASFHLPEPGDRNSSLRLFSVQEPPPLADEFAGDPGVSSLRCAGESSYTKPATDVTVSGNAFAPAGGPVSEMDVRVQVGTQGVALRIFGDRVWERRLGGRVRPSAPAPFVEMPLVWERAYGGVAAGTREARPTFEPRNPVGRGFEIDQEAAIGRPLPNLEDHEALLSSPSDRPRPVGVGPIARHWLPRARWAGTYDEAWRRQRAPFWPDDFDERFFCSAPAPLQVSPHLGGGEAVVLEGLHPGGRVGFHLPTLRLVSSSRFIDRVERRTPALDGVLIDTAVRRLTLYYRAAVPVTRSIVQHRETLLRLIDSWEREPRS